MEQVTERTRLDDLEEALQDVLTDMRAEKAVSSTLRIPTAQHLTAAKRAIEEAERAWGR
jgi:hypothetical protein